jgi:hypothetical protein
LLTQGIEIPAISAGTILKNGAEASFSSLGNINIGILIYFFDFLEQPSDLRERVLQQRNKVVLTHWIEMHTLPVARGFPKS